MLDPAIEDLHVSSIAARQDHRRDAQRPKRENALRRPKPFSRRGKKNVGYAEFTKEFSECRAANGAPEDESERVTHQPVLPDAAGLLEE